jgi:hypothetical protein
MWALPSGFAGFCVRAAALGRRRLGRAAAARVTINQTIRDPGSMCSRRPRVQRIFCCSRFGRQVTNRRGRGTSEVPIRRRVDNTEVAREGLGERVAPSRCTFDGRLNRRRWFRPSANGVRLERAFIALLVGVAAWFWLGNVRAASPEVEPPRRLDDASSPSTPRVRSRMSRFVTAFRPSVMRRSRRCAAGGFNQR